MATINHSAWYAPLLADWQVKLCGPKPTAAHFATVHGWGFRPGVEALHLAMCLRDGGCTVRQFCVAGSCGPANNKRGLVVKRGLATVTVQGKPYSFKLTPTAKGLALIKANEAKANDAAKVSALAKVLPTAKGKGKGNGKPASKPRKPRGPKAPPAPKPASEPASVTAAPPVTAGDAPISDAPTS